MISSLHTLARAATFAAALATSMMPALSRAQACGCLCGGSSAFGASAFETISIATNPRIFARLDGRAPETLRWVEVASGESIPIAIEPAGDSAQQVFVIAPSEVLQPSTEYRLSVDIPATATLPAQTETLSMRTLDGEDHEPPDARGIHVASLRGVRDLCFETAGGTLHFDPDASAFGITDHPVHEIELWRGETRIGRALMLESAAGVFGAETASGASADCFGPARIEGLVVGETVRARSRVWDAAGNASPFVESELEIVIGAARPAGSPCPYCAVSAPGAGAGSGGALAAIAALALVAAARSRRK